MNFATMLSMILHTWDDVDWAQNDGYHVAVGSNASSVITIFRISHQHILKSHELVSSVRCLLVVKQLYVLLHETGE